MYLQNPVSERRHERRELDRVREDAFCCVDLVLLDESLHSQLDEDRAHLFERQQADVFELLLVRDVQSLQRSEDPQVRLGVELVLDVRLDDLQLAVVEDAADVYGVLELRVETGRHPSLLDYLHLVAGHLVQDCSDLADVQCLRFLCDRQRGDDCLDREQLRCADLQRLAVQLALVEHRLDEQSREVAAAVSHLRSEGLDPELVDDHPAVQFEEVRLLCGGVLEDLRVDRQGVDVSVGRTVCYCGVRFGDGVDESGEPDLQVHQFIFVKRVFEQVVRRALDFLRLLRRIECHKAWGVQIPSSSCQ